MKLKELEQIKTAEEDALKFKSDAQEEIKKLEEEKNQKVLNAKIKSDNFVDSELKKITEKHQLTLKKSEEDNKNEVGNALVNFEKRWEESKEDIVLFILKEAKKRYVRS